MAGLRSSAGPILLASLRDLQWRSRRVVLAALAAGLVFGVALMMSGVANSFTIEIRNTVSSLGATSWFVKAGSPGPFTDPAPFPAAVARQVSAIPGIASAEPLLVGRALTHGAISSNGTASTSTSSERNVNMLGVVPGGVGAPTPVEGNSLGGTHTAVVDKSLGVSVGQKIALNGVVFKVVGLTDGVTYFAGQPVVFVPLASAQQLETGGASLATAVVTRGSPTGTIAGYTSLTDAQVRADLQRPITQADSTIQLIQILLWIVAAGIIGAIVYLSALERRRDFAVLKAVGTPSFHLFVGLVIQAVIMALIAAIIGILIEIPMSSSSAMVVRLSTSNYVSVPVVALIVGVIASVMPARRAARVDPAIAFGSGN